MVGQNRTGISLAWLSVHGTGHAFTETFETRRPGHIRLDRIAKQHDIDYSRAMTLRDKHAADRKVIKAIDRFGDRKTTTEKIVKKIMQAKVKLKM